MKLKHVVLYCKGHYLRTDIWEDLKKCLEAHEYCPDTHSDVLAIIQAHLTELVLAQYNDAKTSVIELLRNIAPYNSWKVGYYHKSSPKFILANIDSKIEELPEYDYQEALLRAYMSRICYSTREELGIADDYVAEPDASVLPLKREKHNEGTYKDH